MVFHCRRLGLRLVFWGRRQNGVGDMDPPPRSRLRLVTEFDENFVCPLFHLSTHGNLP